MDAARTRSFVDATWDDAILPALCEYVKIPNQSPLFDRAWREHGHMERATSLVANWIEEQKIPGAKLEVVRLEDRTPLIYVDVPGDGDDVVLLYGHLDKQPPMLPWAPGLDPWTPVVKNGRLYGRGGADDGYAAFASTTALKALKAQGAKHARCVMLIEACEESGSFDLPYYIEHLAPRLGKPSLVVCLDSGCGDYERLWSTTSLRGLVAGDLVVEVLTEGVHSGDGSGVIASSFRILRGLLDRLEDARTGRILPDVFHTPIPEARKRQAATAAGVIGEAIHRKMPTVPGMKPMSDDLVELMLNRTWRPMLSVTGAAGLPPLENAGNVLRPKTAVKLSLRLPPRLDAPKAAAALKELLEKDPPYGAKVSFGGEKASAGWDAPPLAPWLEKATDDASAAFFGKPACYMGEGGSIPFMGMLGARFPDAQFLITGVLGPQSNAHGPNEFLDLATGKRLTASVAHVIAEHFARRR
ncbi:MAG TPA: M20 family metallopeptidase [Planctomycetota bacterium]|nr:M20 family metallopeptidase [Planctomycetota bacterium]